MPAKWVDFKEVKQTVSIVDVLERYGDLAELVQKGDALEGCCPIHGGDSPTQFRVSIAKNCWNCFGPCSGGNVLDFVAQREGVSIRDAALLLAEWFEISTTKPTRSGQAAAEPSEPEPEDPEEDDWERIAQLL